MYHSTDNASNLWPLHRPHCVLSCVSESLLRISLAVALNPNLCLEYRVVQKQICRVPWRQFPCWSFLACVQEVLLAGQNYRSLPQCFRTSLWGPGGGQLFLSSFPFGSPLGLKCPAQLQKRTVQKVHFVLARRCRLICFYRVGLEEGSRVVSPPPEEWQLANSPVSTSLIQQPRILTTIKSKILTSSVVGVALFQLILILPHCCTSSSSCWDSCFLIAIYVTKFEFKFCYIFSFTMCQNFFWTLHTYKVGPIMYEYLQLFDT